MGRDLLIFTKAASAYEPTRFLSEALGKGLNAEIVTYSDLDFYMDNLGIRVYWKGEEMMVPKTAVFRAAGGDNFYIPQRDFLLRWFSSEGCRVLNEKSYRKWSRLDKITQHFCLVEAGLPVIPSKIYGNNERVYVEERGYPFIMKKNLSSRGRDVFKIKTKTGLTRLFNRDYFARTMLLQPFLRSGQDLRVIVLGGQALGAMKRIAKPGKFLTNYSQGGMIEAYDLDSDPTAQHLAEAIARLFDLDYVGVDLMKDNEGKWRVLEVNRACQFQGFEKSTGVNVPQKVIEYLLTKKQ